MKKFMDLRVCQKKQIFKRGLFLKKDQENEGTDNLIAKINNVGRRMLNEPSRTLAKRFNQSY